MKPSYSRYASHSCPVLLELNVRDPKFPAKCMALTERMRSEMDETVAQSKTTIAETRILIAEANRLLRQR
jgi:hypothetical protein